MTQEPTPPPGTIGKRRFDSREQEVYLNLWRAYDRLKMIEEEVFSRFELTPQQYNVLRILKSERPKPVPTLSLARRLVSRAPDITRMLDKLEQRHLIARERDAGNRRVVHVTITSAGLELLKTMHPAVCDSHARQLGHLSEADLTHMANLLRAARAPHEEDDSVWKTEI